MHDEEAPDCGGACVGAEVNIRVGYAVVSLNCNKWVVIDDGAGYGYAWTIDGVG